MTSKGQMACTITTKRYSLSFQEPCVKQHPLRRSSHVLHLRKGHQKGNRGLLHLLTLVALCDMQGTRPSFSMLASAPVLGPQKAVMKTASACPTGRKMLVHPPKKILRFATDTLLAPPPSGNTTPPLPGICSQWLSQISSWTFSQFWEMGGILFREHCFGRLNSLSSAPTLVSSAKNSVTLRWHTKS